MPWVARDSSHGRCTRVKTVQPFLTFFLAHGQVLAPGRLPTSLGSRAQTCWANSPKGTRSGVMANVVWTNNHGRPYGPKAPTLGGGCLVQLTSVVSCTAKTTGTAPKRVYVDST